VLAVFAATLAANPSVAQAQTTDRMLAFDESPAVVAPQALSGDFTISAWIQPSGDINNRDGIVTNSDRSFDLNFWAGRFRLHHAGTDIAIASTPLVADQWTHVSAVRQNGTVRLYINGQLDATSTINWTNTVRFDLLGTGIAGVILDTGLVGNLDDVQVWNTARTAAQLQNDSVGELGNTNSLLRNYTFNGTTNQITDASGNSPAATLPTGASLTTSTAPNPTATNPNPTPIPTEGPNRALLLDGTTRVNVEDLSLSGDFTISAWVNFTDGSTVSNVDGLVAGPQSSVNFFQNQARLLGSGQDIVVASTPSQTGVWTHVSFVRSDGTVRLFINGNQNASSAALESHNAIGTPFRGNFAISELFGGIPGASTGTQGLIDDLQIWTVARSQDELFSDITGALTTTSNLARRYTFDGDANSIIDTTGSSAAVAVPGGAQLVASTAPFEVVGSTNNGFTDTQVLGGLFLPTDLAFLPDGRMLVIEKSGRIVINEDPTVPGSTIATYMDISSITLNDAERGLLNIEVDPNFEDNNFFYLYHTMIEGPVARTTVSRFTHVENGGGASSRGSAASQFILWQENDVTSRTVHQGGGLSIGLEPIGANDPSPYKLYIVTADDGEPVNAGDLTHDDGKVHRVNLTDGSIPTDNPYYDPAVAATYTPQVDSGTSLSRSAANLALDPQGVLTTIHSRGIRNGWRASYDQESNSLFIGEVGSNINGSEDIHVASPGANYGFPAQEGFLNNPNDPGNPIHSYPHIQGPGQDDVPFTGNASVTGGVVYRGNNFPDEFQGAYFYGDWARNWIRYLEIDYSGDRPELISDNFFQNATGRVLSFDEGPDGALYYLITFQTGSVFTFEGTVNRLVFDADNAAPAGSGINVANSDLASPSAPHNVQFSANVSDPDGDQLSYLWSFGDGDDLDGDGVGDTATSTAPSPSYTYTQSGVYRVDLTVTDSNGASTVFRPVTITVGNPPQGTITGIIDGGTYRAGEVISFDGFATDVEDGAIPNSGLVWSSAYFLDGLGRPGPFNDTAYRPGGLSFETLSSGSVESFINSVSLFLTATDSSGLSSTVEVQLIAEQSELSFDAPIAGDFFVFDGRTQTGDFVFPSTIDFNHTIEAPATYSANGQTFTFSHWADNPGLTNRVRDFQTPDVDSEFIPVYTS